MTEADVVTPEAEAIEVPETEKRSGVVALRHHAIRAVATSLAGLDRCFGDRLSDGFGILMYHRCCEEPADTMRPTMNVTPGQLEKQLGGLINRGFAIRSLPDVISDLEAGTPIDRKTVVVTFDDAFAGMHRYVLPVLKRLDVTASVFVCTKFVGCDAPMPFDPWGLQHAGRVDDVCYRSVNDDECRALVDSGHFDVGAHTHSHEDFRNRSDDFEADLKQNVRELRDRFGVERPTFAFPFGTPSLGFSDSSLADAAKRCGVQCAVTTGPQVNNDETDRFALGRFNVFPWDTAATLQARLHGWYSWLPAASAAVRSTLRRGRGHNPSRDIAHTKLATSALATNQPLGR